MHHGIRIPLHQSLYCCSSSQSSLIWVFFKMWKILGKLRPPRAVICNDSLNFHGTSHSRRTICLPPFECDGSRCYSCERPWRQDDWHVSHLSTGAARSRCEGGGGTWRKPPAVSGNLGTRGWGGGDGGGPCCSSHFQMRLKLIKNNHFGTSLAAFRNCMDDGRLGVFQQ